MADELPRMAVTSPEAARHAERATAGSRTVTVGEWFDFVENRHSDPSQAPVPATLGLGRLASIVPSR